MPPNLDVVLLLSDSSVVAIESKFSEWLTPRPKSKEAFRPAYFRSMIGEWRSVGLPCSQELAQLIDAEQQEFRFLDAPQLLKHGLGLGKQLKSRFVLWYIYFDWTGKESAIHSEELELFSRKVGSEIGFRSLSYQQLLDLLRSTSNVEGGYLDYLEARYK